MVRIVFAIGAMVFLSDSAGMSRSIDPGSAKSTDGIQTAGLTCAAFHTGEIMYGGKA